MGDLAFGLGFQDLYRSEGLQRVDVAFLARLRDRDAVLADRLVAARFAAAAAAPAAADCNNNNRFAGVAFAPIIQSIVLNCLLFKIKLNYTVSKKRLIIPSKILFVFTTL